MRRHCITDDPIRAHDDDPPKGFWYDGDGSGVGVTTVSPMPLIGQDTDCYSLGDGYGNGKSQNERILTVALTTVDDYLIWSAEQELGR